jgi:hypothetical protein
MNKARDKRLAKIGAPKSSFNYRQALRDGSIISSEWTDEDGHWIALKDGWMDSCNPHCHTIHEDNAHEARKVFAAVPCDCTPCLGGK